MICGCHIPTGGVRVISGIKASSKNTRAGGLRGWTLTIYLPTQIRPGQKESLIHLIRGLTAGKYIMKAVVVPVVGLFYFCNLHGH